ncbi:glycosyltransferase family 2 protein [Paraburkholderia rhizosphaerae]|uniref:GT2 family glycosyltransferase n=1 Tax=Paraburkholderia rhizosphaerae TaxID=480658 RepID=A0A4R8L8G4_9BURK|nr:glycosyltransferase [Paraburkholderia rhizosphaerae]TDY39066.1 GT2 family glycosyltransferase [Paraburkholderia rhizosphaerae]
MPRPTPAPPRISVVVLTRDRAGQLVGTLARLTSLPEQPPVFVADNASCDDTVKLVDMLFPQVRVVQCCADLGAAARNRAVACVRTDYVAFCDDDSWWEAGSLARAVKLLDGAPQVAVLSARVIDGTSGITDPACARMAASPLTVPGWPEPALAGYLAGACVFRTAVFRAVGGYEPRLVIGGEEALVALDVLSAGHAIGYCRELTVRRTAPVVRDDGAVRANDCERAADHGPRRDDDVALRRRLLARNAAWVAWLRLPWLEVCRTTFGALAMFAREHALWRDGRKMIGGLGWALANRHRVSAQVLAMRAEVRAAERRLARGGLRADRDAQHAKHTVAEPRSHDH